MEADEPSKEADTHQYQQYNMRINVVLWLNLKQLNPAYTSASDFIDELMGELTSTLPSSAPYHTIRLFGLRIGKKQAGIYLESKCGEVTNTEINVD